MAEVGTEISQKPPERTGLIRRLGNALNSVRRSFEIEDNKVPVEKINPQTVAQTIDKYIFNPLQEQISGDRWKNGFDITTAMKNMGHVATLIDTNYMTKFP